MSISINDSAENKSKDNLPKQIVDLNYRYSVAWSEVNTRIAQRQNALQIYVTLSSAILAVLFSGRRVCHQVPPCSESAPFDSPFLGYIPYLVCALLPLVSLVFGFLNLKHEQTIKYLQNFLIRCEKYNEQVDINLPGYHHKDINGYSSAKWWRTFHDLASILLIILFNAIGFFIAKKIFSGTELNFFVHLIIGGGLISIVMILYGLKKVSPTL